MNEGFQKIINSFDFERNFQPVYLSACGCNDNSECRCVSYFDCRGHDCSCHYYDPEEDYCARFDCITMCKHGIWGV